MKTEYKRDMNHNYLILHGDNEIDTASYQVRMLVGNVIPSLLKCRIQGMDGKFMVYYDITSRQSLSTFYEDKKLRREEVKLIFTAFVRVMEDTVEYLVNPEQLVISPDLIFLEADRKELYFCLMPGHQKDIREQLQTLAEYILPKIDHEDEEAVRLGYGIYRRALEDSFHLEHIKEELYRERLDEKIPVPGKAPGSYESDKRTKMDYGTEIEKEDCDLWNDEKNRLNFVREGMENCDRSISKGRKAGKAILVGILFLVAAGGIMAAKILGYLPQIGMEVILGAVITGIGAGMLIYLGVKKAKESHENNNEIKNDHRKKSGSRKENGNKKELRERSTFPGKIGQQRNGLHQILSNEEDRDKSYERMQGKEVISSSPDVRKISKNSMSEKTIKHISAQEEPLFDKGDYLGETVILSAAAAPGPASLVSHEPGELAPVFLREDITVIGKLENACDAVINLPTVSRIHAKIRKRENEYYLTDLNSRNGTSVNGRLLRPDEDYKLENEDQVDFAQARYIFINGK